MSHRRDACNRGRSAAPNRPRRLMRRVGGRSKRGKSLQARRYGLSRLDEDVLDLTDRALRHSMFEADRCDAPQPTISSYRQQRGDGRQSTNIVAAIHRNALDASTLHLSEPVLEARRLLPTQLRKALLQFRGAEVRSCGDTTSGRA